MDATQKENAGCFKTRLALLWMNLTNEPLAALYSLFPFILCKDLGATTYQLTLFITLRPVLSVFSFYWGSYLTYRKNKLLPNLIGAWVLARLPFLCFPLLDNFWFLLFACGVYQLFSKAATPALMEILKRNIPKEPREHVFSFYYVLSFVESVILGLAFGSLLDWNGTLWKILLVLSAVIGLSSLFVQMRIRVPEDEENLTVLPANRLIQPLKESFQLLRSKPDFAHFQWGFMIGGFALMLMAPALTIFYAKTLDLSHANITIARFVLMAIGVAFSSFLWKKGLSQLGINRLIMWVLAGFGFFPVVLLLAQWNLSFLYFAFFIYGIAQAGSHLIWNLSGTIFAGEGNSAPFTTVNVLMVGVRGAVGPILGGFLCDALGPIPVLGLGAALAFAGIWVMAAKKRMLARMS